MKKRTRERIDKSAGYASLLHQVSANPKAFQPHKTPEKLSANQGKKTTTLPKDPKI
ncbi:hypothetical protein [Succinimonas sp.]|uniref:hypothetical protein n=1 Tax=Succinimonas sp. TaxID=1936151 RepID=UPI00386D501A